MEPKPNGGARTMRESINLLIRDRESRKRDALMNFFYNETFNKKE